MSKSDWMTKIGNNIIKSCSISIDCHPIKPPKYECINCAAKSNDTKDFIHKQIFSHKQLKKSFIDKYLIPNKLQSFNNLDILEFEILLNLHKFGYQNIDQKLIDNMNNIYEENKEYFNACGHDLDETFYYVLSIKDIDNMKNYIYDYENVDFIELKYDDVYEDVYGPCDSPYIRDNTETIKNYVPYDQYLDLWYKLTQ